MWETEENNIDLANSNLVRVYQVDLRCSREYRCQAHTGVGFGCGEAQLYLGMTHKQLDQLKAGITCTAEDANFYHLSTKMKTPDRFTGLARDKLGY
jgi:hypothetical protein